MSCPFANSAAGKTPVVNIESLKSEIRGALINEKSFACPIAARVAWHASGTFCHETKTGGSDGARMRFDPEMSDPANAGLNIVRDMLHEVKKKHPDVSNADLWTMAGCAAIEFMGGPKVPHKLGRTDADNGALSPAPGRLPDASQGADHVRQVFNRMGFNDREIVALCGAHTVGRCHITRSGYDGPWTHNPLQFDNAYFKNLLNLTWVKKEWHQGYNGPLQYTDKETGKLMMLPTDLALIQDLEFRKYVEIYADNQAVFFADFAKAFARLVSLGCPAECNPEYVAPVTEAEVASAAFREACMHGSLGPIQKLSQQGADVHAVEEATGRSGLHKATYWGHIDATRYLVEKLKVNMDVQDKEGDTALHDAARFGHESVVRFLVEAGANLSIHNNAGHTALEVATEYNKDQILPLLRAKL
jgi:catalase (peroxidase I)